MALEKLFFPPTSFYLDKILPTIEKGLSRIELSNYFYNFTEYVEKIDKVESFEN